MFKKFYRVQDAKNVQPSRGNPRGLLVADVQDGQLVIGYSVCSKKDKFKRKLAHTIANGRFARGEFKAPLDNIDELKNSLPEGTEQIFPLIDDAVKFFTHRISENYN